MEVDPNNKSKEFLGVNPSGLVPAIDHNGKSVYESSVCIQYVDEAWTTKKHLLPSDPFQRARARIWSNHITYNVVPPFYKMLNTNSKEQSIEVEGDLLS